MRSLSRTVFPLHAVAILGDDGTASMVGAIFAASAVVGFGGAPLGGYLADRCCDCAVTVL